MKLRRPWMIRLVAFLGAGLIRLWTSTLRFRVFFAGGVRHPPDHRKQRCIYAFWHENMLMPAMFRARLSVLISQHADGELIAQVCRFLGFRVVRGSSTRGGGPALFELHRESRTVHLGVTPDGPRGPRRRVQPGLIFLASLTRLPIVPIGIGYSRAWRARSWDRFAVPKPFSMGCGVCAPAIHVPPDLKREELEDYVRLVEEQLQKATDAAERWAQGGPSPAADPVWNEAHHVRASA